jgi:hypothetical protein
MVVLVPGVTKPDRETGAMKATLPATWPKFDRVPLGPVVSLEAALSGHYDADPFDPRGYHDGRCYLMQCAPMAVRAGHGPRLATDAWKHEGGVRMQLLLTDIDASDKRADDAWWAAQAPALEAFLALHPGAFIARSRGGLRIYQVLSEPFLIDSPARADEWKARYESWCASVRALPWERAKVDETKDWARLQRIPHDTRDGVLQLLETIGDPSDVGTVALPEPAPKRQRRPALRAWTGGSVECRVAKWVLERVAAVLPHQGDGVHEAAMALGGILAASYWSTDDCVEVVEVTFGMAGLCREDIGRSARTSLDNARTGGRAFGWPRFKGLCKGEPEAIEAACNALEKNVPGLARHQWSDQKGYHTSGHHD